MQKRWRSKSRYSSSYLCAQPIPTDGTASAKAPTRMVPGAYDDMRLADRTSYLGGLPKCSHADSWVRARRLFARVDQRPWSSVDKDLYYVTSSMGRFNDV